MLENIHWYGAASIKVDAGDRAIYFDPSFQDEAPPVPHDADVILVTHPHVNHFEPDVIARLTNERTVLIVPEDCLDDVREMPGVSAVALRPGDALTVADGIRIEAVRAYTLRHTDHPRERNWNGYIVTVDGVRIYHSGSTDPVPEHEGLSADIAILAFYPGYIMNTEEAADLALRMGAKAVVPIHAQPDDKEKLRGLLEGKVLVDVKERSL